MGWRYILVNHTRKIIVESHPCDIWKQVNYLIQNKGWHKDDNVEMMYEENEWDKIGKLVVNEGYESHYHPSSFD